VEDISLQSRVDVLTEQQTLIQDSAVAFIAHDEELKKTRASRFVQPGYDQKTWQDLAELGWLGFLIPEQYGGIGLGFEDLHPVLIQLGKGLVPAPFVATAVIAAGVLVYSDNEAIKKARLPNLVAGEWKPALAWQETQGQMNAEARELRIVDGKLNGKKILVPDAGGADDFIVSAVGDMGTELYLVSKAASGLTIDYEQRVDGGFYANLSFDQVSAGELLAGADRAEQILESALDEGRVAASVELLGVMTRSLEITVDYLSQRVQFDKPIGSFQALQHKSVDLFILSEISRSVVLQTVGLLDGEAPAHDRAVGASQVKARCSDAALQITKSTIQLHGGIGYTDEANIGLYLKKAMYLASWLGNATAHRARYAELTM
jgi:alkylation response protein AidB-like acyl-CoA dehydrogenase